MDLEVPRDLNSVALNHLKNCSFRFSVINESDGSRKEAAIVSRQFCIQCSVASVRREVRGCVLFKALLYYSFVILNHSHLNHNIFKDYYVLLLNETNNKVCFVYVFLFLYASRYPLPGLDESNIAFGPPND